MASAQQMNPTPTQDIPGIVEALRTSFASGKTRPAAWRKQQLKRIRQMTIDREKEIMEALRADFGKSTFESYLSETGFVVSDVDHALKHLAEWMQPERIPTPIALVPSRAEILRQPKGVVLIIGPWNYPYNLVIVPLVAAVAAGNCAVLKPSELTPHTSAVIAAAVKDYLDPSAVRVVEGGIEESQALLREKFDHIFYTGSTRVGRLVMKAASEHLTPVTLELGGKSPCVVDESVDMKVAIRRITWGRFFNGGQTCIAPDYLLVHKRRYDEVLQRLPEQIKAFYGSNPQQSPDFPRIINDAHFKRLSDYLSAGRVVCGGETDASTRYIAPTVLADVSPDDPVMQDEIFGPILPVLKVDDMDEAVSFITARPHPLALYVFSRNRAVHDKFVQETISGDMCINDVVAHFGAPEIPFGGIGESGMGAYHGRHGFDTFSHQRGLVTRPYVGDVPVRYPPYSDSKLRWLRRLL